MEILNQDWVNTQKNISNDIDNFLSTNYNDEDIEKLQEEENRMALNIKNNDSDNKKDNLYSFKIEDIIELEKYLKSNIMGQNEVIEKYINHLMLNTYRNENNEKNLWIFFNFWPSWSWKNYLFELLAKKLDFWMYVLDLSQYHYIEISSLLWATDGFWNDNNSILEHIWNMSLKYKWKMILIFDEIEKWMISDNWNINTFFTWIMNIINSKKVYTKNNNEEIDLSNFIFVFNSNIGFDNYEEEEIIENKIWFDIDLNNKTKIEKESIDEKYVEKLMKNKMKINISVFNRLKKWNNFFFFNNLDKSLFDNYLIKKYSELQEELEDNFWNKKIPEISYFSKRINNFDYTRGFRWINDLIFIDFKLHILKNIIFKNIIKNKVNNLKML